MPDFCQRSREEELLDDLSIEPGEVRRTLDELEVINRWLGGYGTSLQAVERLLPPGKKTLSLLDVGSGGGEFCRRLAGWGIDRGLEVSITGIDLSAPAVEHATESCRDIQGVRFEQRDLFDLEGENKFDIVHAALVLHHFPDPTAVPALARMYELSTRGVVINDLHRHPVAYYSIKWLTRCLSRSRLIRNDAPLSVLRAFRRRELVELMEQAGIRAPALYWRWAFRWQGVAAKPSGDGA